MYTNSNNEYNTILRKYEEVIQPIQTVLINEEIVETVSEVVRNNNIYCMVIPS